MICFIRPPCNIYIYIHIHIPWLPRSQLGIGVSYRTLGTMARPLTMASLAMASGCSLSLCLRPTPLYTPLSLSLFASSTHPLFPFSPFSLFLSLYIHRLPPSRSSFFLPSSPSTFIFLNSPLLLLLLRSPPLSSLLTYLRFSVPLSPRFPCYMPLCPTRVVA